MTDRASGNTPTTAQLGLAALFVTALVTSQVTATKIIGFQPPTWYPFAVLALPGAAVAYAVTFFASDCFAELYGREAAQRLVNVAFVMNFVLLALIWTTISAPALAAPDNFEGVLVASRAIVLGSLCAYVVSQNWDVVVFDSLRERTGGDRLWLRNLGSTATSQAIDTVLFVTVAFLIAPAVLGWGVTPPNLLALMVGQYLLKLLVAVVDTPFVYLVVGAVRYHNDETESPFAEFGV